jgi:ubiquinone/menaquinone biosynthesis C-methylase UbiE
MDSAQVYKAEIDSVREIYRDEFSLTGSILDVGGHQGRLREHLGGDVGLYVVLDVFANVFAGAETQPGLLAAYQCLSLPCNFVAAQAERLPFATHSFDWVHMRSVLDHFQNPYWALREGYRVLAPNGHLLVGLKVIDRPDRAGARLSQMLSSQVRRKLDEGGVLALLRAAALRARSGLKDHTFRWSLDELVELIGLAGFEVVKVHRQKPPFADCVYIAARRFQAERVSEVGGHSRVEAPGSA